MKSLFCIIAFITLFSCADVKGQSVQNIDIIDNLDMFLSIDYIDSNDTKYMYLEISVWNGNNNDIYFLKNYDIDKIVEEEDGIILYLSSWIDALDSLKNSSALYHNPRMLEVRNKQNIYIPLLLKVPDEFKIFNNNNVIKKIIGLKYSLSEYITEDITWAKNVDEFAQNIRSKVNDLEFNYNKYTHKYGNIIYSQIKPPEWMLGTWKTDGKALLDGDIINTTTKSLEVVSDDIFENNRSLHGWIITRIENTITQSYTENTYCLDIIFEDGRIDYYHFNIDNGYLIMNHSNHNGLWVHKFERE